MTNDTNNEFSLIWKLNNVPNIFIMMSRLFIQLLPTHLDLSNEEIALVLMQDRV